MGVDDVVPLPPHQRRQRAHIGEAQPPLLDDEQARAQMLDLPAQPRLHRRGGEEVHLHARLAQPLEPLQGKHGDAVARDRHGECVQYAHQSFASSAVMVVSYLPVFCAS